MSSRTLLLFIVLCVEIRFFIHAHHLVHKLKNPIWRCLSSCPEIKYFSFFQKSVVLFRIYIINLNIYIFATSFYYNCCTLISYVYKQYLIYIILHDIVKALHFTSQTQTVLQCWHYRCWIWTRCIYHIIHFIREGLSKIWYSLS